MIYELPSLENRSDPSHSLFPGHVIEVRKFREMIANGSMQLLSK